MTFTKDGRENRVLFVLVNERWTLSHEKLCNVEPFFPLVHWCPFGWSFSTHARIYMWGHEWRM